ncbi:hypothetical protein CHUAL_011366 [Chamberlinius hualienensis]
MANILIAIVLCFNIFIPGKCQHYTIVQPHKVVIANGIITYKCQFKWKVDCVWQNNDGSTVIIEYSKFSYVTGNGWNTNDCSISTLDVQTAMKIPNMHCIGLPTMFKDRTVSETSIKLDCTSEDHVNCTWKTHDHFLRVGSRYKYIDGHNGINVTDCSITINNISSIDEGQWMCYGKVKNLTSGYWIIIAAYYLNISTSIEPNATCPPPSGK